MASGIFLFLYFFRGREPAALYFDYDSILTRLCFPETAHRKYLDWVEKTLRVYLKSVFVANFSKSSSRNEPDQVVRRNQSIAISEHRALPLDIQRNLPLLDIFIS